MNNELINLKKKHRWVLYLLQDQIKNLYDFRSDPSGSRSGSESAIPGTGSATPGTGSADPDPDPDPHQNEMDPKHC